MLQDRLEQQNLVISFIFVRVHYLTTVERSFLQDHLLSHLDSEAGITTFLWFLVLHIWYLHYGSTALRSLIYVDVGEPTSHPCSMTGMIQDHHLLASQDFESLGTSMSEICYDIAKQY